MKQENGNTKKEKGLQNKKAAEWNDSLTHSHPERPKQADNFGNIFLTKALFGKYS